MHYYRKPPRKSFFAYIAPFLILALLGGIFFFLFRFWDDLKTGLGQEESYAVMENLEGEAKVLFQGNTEWVTLPGGMIKLFKGDAIRALPGSKIKITLFERHSFVLNSNSEIVINELRKDNQTLHTVLELVSGEAWFDVQRDINPNSTFLLQAGHLIIDTKGADFDLEPDVVRVFEGSVDVAIDSNDDTLLSDFEVGVGQELILNEAKLTALQNDGLTENLRGMIADEFKLSDWYLYNTTGQISDISNVTVSSKNVVESTEDKDNQITTPDDSSDEISTESEFVLKKPIILSPAKDGEEFKITTDFQAIEGTVQEGTAKVIVNNYPLSAFKKGDTKWLYNAAVRYGNLEKGKNVYKIYAVDEAGNKSDPAEITLIYGEADKVEDTSVETEETVISENTDTDEKVETEESTETETNSSESEENVTGEFEILEPNNGENFKTTQTHFDFQGTAPSNTAKIVVATYTLQSYKPSDTTWRYTVDPQFNNIFVGEDNTYKATAYDAADNVIAETQITITVEKATEETGSGETVE